MTTFAAVLARLLRGDAGRPLVTFYDHATGERTELSVTTYANWVAKTASLLAEEHDLERGQAIRIDLPTHWLGPVFLGRRLDRRAGRDSTTTTPTPSCAARTGLDRWAAYADGRGRARQRAAARSAAASASRCRPASTTSASRSGRSPTRSSPCDPPGADDDGAGGDARHAELWTAAAAGSVLTDGGRLLTEANPASPSGSRLLHRAAGPRRLGGPGGPRGPGAARGDVRRRARHSRLRTCRRSAGQVVAAIPSPRIPARLEARRVAPAVQLEVARCAFSRTTRSARP